MISQADGKNLRRYPVLAFVICLLLSYSAEEFFGVADIIGAFVAGLIVASTPKAQYIRLKFEPLSYLLLTPVFFSNIGINVQLPELNVGLVLFSLALLATAILSKVIGCGLGAKLCGFQGMECVQVGAGMACRGEVALIVANRGLSMGIITVVGCAVLTPLLLKAAFRNEPASKMEQSALSTPFHQAEQLEQASAKFFFSDKK